MLKTIEIEEMNDFFDFLRVDEIPSDPEGDVNIDPFSSPYSQSIPEQPEQEGRLYQ